MMFAAARISVMKDYLILMRRRVSAVSTDRLRARDVSWFETRVPRSSP
jgi:hypothetical protein